jgi:hypothetical protein
MTALAVAACNPCIKAAKIDVKGAFIQTEMVSPPVFIKCRPKLTQLIVKLLPGLRKYMSKDGRLYCKLLKALNGCVQASKLWFEKLVKVLHAEGYEHSLTDPCVMRRVVGDIVYFLLIYVDDILILAEQQEIEQMKEVFLKHFMWIIMEISEKHSYLGMLINLCPGEVEIDMEFHVHKVLEGCNNLPLANTPATKKLFEESAKRVVLAEEEKKKFHTMVARLLYLSKCARPDILTAVGFLCTCVKESTMEDQQKLLRLLGYLQVTVDKKLHLRPEGVFRVEAYVDAAFAIHGDSKSHTGVAVFMGGALVYEASRKQKCMTKSPTESELVALTDNVGFVELFEEFLSFLLNVKERTPIIYQDCTSVIDLVTKGGGVVRTKHLRARMNVGKEAIMEERIKVVYYHTSNMIADGLTKPLEGNNFATFADILLGQHAME